MDINIESFWAAKPWIIPGTPWEIIGYSRACYRTGFYIKALDLMIDAGPQKTGNPKTILITHCHGDHIASIPFTLIEQKSEVTVHSLPDIFIHERSKDKLNNYIKSMFSANYNQDFKAAVANYFSVKNQDVLDYTANNTKLRIEVFGCIHDVPTVGYGISTKKQHLKQEYFDLKGNGKALCELKKQGIDITKTTYEPNIVFIWDTKIDVLKNKRILEYPVVMIECSFLFDDDYEQSLSKKHIHWKSLKPYIVDNPHVFFVLMHFSLRYKESEIAAFFKKEALINVKPWLQQE
jgi:ribonuclease Z